MVIAVGFDGTCVTNEYPNVGEHIGAAQMLSRFVLRGHKIVLNTTRVNMGKNRMYLYDAIRWFQDNGIPLYSIHGFAVGKTNASKCRADLYIDARGIGCPLIWGDHHMPYVDWVKVEKLVSLMDAKLKQKDPVL